ncbi:MAG: rRNA maturation RNase YbeY [Desulfovibrio sp.]|jgi:probable rRNA maturation factor|nr:rRNA maturation RNase YbeY [Desulfovibrio sp.]
MPVDILSSPPAGIWKLPLARPELRSALDAMLAAAGSSGSSMELLLAGDALMEELNRTHLGSACPTNILAFPGASRSLRPPGPRPGKTAPGLENLREAPPEHFPPARMLGSLVLAPEAVRRECFLYGQEAAGHTLRLLAHGLAHLLGLDHGPDLDRLTALLEKSARQNTLPGLRMPCS